MKSKMSGPAIFMHSVIWITAITSIICFSLYYGSYYRSETCLWIGIVAFSIMYHFWVRIIFGDIVKLFKNKISYRQWWFKERKFEKKLYKFLHVKEWKDKALTYIPEKFSIKNNSLEEVANNMAEAEIVHWINELISLSTLLFAIPWGQFWIFFVTALFAMIFDSQFLIIQRFNRPRIVKAIEREKKSKKENEIYV